MPGEQAIAMNEVASGAPFVHEFLLNAAHKDAGFASHKAFLDLPVDRTRP
jgi:hypothetical protein